MSLFDYFFSPIKTGYDVPKTLTYSIALIIAVYLIFKLLKRLKIRADKRLAVAVSPYVLFGSAIRVLEDTGAIESYLFITPGVYFFIFFLFLSMLIVSLVLDRKKNIPYFKTMFLAGLVTLSFVFSQFDLVNIRVALLVFILLVPWLAVIYATKWSKENKIVLSLHMFDATTTFIAMSFFGYYEQHILPTFLINIFGPVSFIFGKLIAITAILLLIDRFCKDNEFNIYLKIVIGLLGAATGSRDFINLLVLG
jgi:uncharacterized membrane protein